jgi:DNA repair protein RecN (Recombination protein N)
MLSRLRIKDFALIQDVDLKTEKGFTVITGETGSGKSILLDALGFLLGNRADSGFVSSSSKKCVIEGEFIINDYGLEDFFIEKDWEYESPCIIRREINQNGRSRAFVNDSPVLLNDLNLLGDLLMDVHVQNAALLLAKESFYYDLLDGISGAKTDREQYLSKYLNYKSLLSEYQVKREGIESSRLALDYKRFQLKELESIEPLEGEQEELENELQTLGSAEEITAEVQKAILVLNEQDQSVSELIQAAENSIRKIQHFSPKLAEVNDRLNGLQIELSDLIDELNVINNSISGDSGRLEEVDARLTVLLQAVKKFVVKDADQLVALKNQLTQEVADVVGGDEQLENLKHQLEQQENDLKKLGAQLLKRRKAGAELLIKEVKQDCEALKMPNIELIAEQNPAEINRWGTQTLSFLFSANKGSTPKKLNKVASGGELSRLMLVFKKILARYQKMPTIIFDEIDTGVSGEVANKMAEMMKSMAGNQQLLAITHIPQTVGKAEHHLKVWKEHKAEQTESFIKKLNSEERLIALAEMLSGNKITEAAMQNAKEILTSGS